MIHFKMQKAKFIFISKFPRNKNELTSYFISKSNNYLVTFESL